MDLKIEGRVAMVAAASKGIGLATARALAGEGCRVSICGRTESTLGEACERIGGTVRGYVADVRSREDLERWVAHTSSELGAPDILVTNTGGPPAGTLDAMDDSRWQEGFESTLLNVVRLVRLVGPGMAERGWGRIVHVSSLVAREPSSVLPISSTLRMGLQNLTRLQASELAPRGVTVNAVLPGHTLTDRQRHLAQLRAEREGGTEDEALARQAESIPMRRIADPREIADAIAFLCSERASYITGVSLLVDGGATHAPG
ncbi:MAG: SDR family oxidoreductase [Fimbriimonadaceae bacterium]|nr:SDR family oxidoreductase [Fimbriimonadaceae bacterium]